MNAPTPAQIERVNAVKKYYASLGKEHALVGYSPADKAVKKAEAPLSRESRPAFVEKIPRHWTIVNNSIRKYKWKTYMDE